MLIFADAQLTYLATPKTGSTAVEMALRPKADIVFAKRRKHMTALRFKSVLAPFLKENFGIKTETVAVMRAPVDQMHSWFKYRGRGELSGGPRSTSDMTFDEFAYALASDAPPEFAQIGSQFSFLTDENGELQIDHLFAYDNQTDFLEFLSLRIGTSIELKRKNVSPGREANLSEKTASLLHDARAKEFALYDRLMAAGGYLGSA